MKKSRALELLGPTPRALAAAIGISPSAVSQWPEELPPRIEDRVLAALARKHLPAELLAGASPAAEAAGAPPHGAVPPVGPGGVHAAG